MSQSNSLLRWVLYKRQNKWTVHVQEKVQSMYQTKDSEWKGKAENRNNETNISQHHRQWSQHSSCLIIIKSSEGIMATCISARNYFLT